MLFNLLKKFLGSKNSRELRRINKIVGTINSYASAFQALTDKELREKTHDFRLRFEGGESLEQLLPEAFATVREVAARTLGMRHFDVQLIGGIALHEGRIAEMRTGEGKTLVATLAAYLNAIPAEGVHIVTVNDYLAKRDALWMGPLYTGLDLSLGVVQSFQAADTANSFLLDASGNNLKSCSRQLAYGADITYGTNNEFGFDYLRDNMCLRLEEKTQRSSYFAIVDEVDSILIDEARTPLIISGAAQDSSKLYKTINTLIRNLVAVGDSGSGDFVIDEKLRQVELTEEGHLNVETALVKAQLLNDKESLYQASNLGLLHHVSSALRAHYLFKADVEYIVQDGNVILIDEHTGRTMPGRRLSEGLHQAIEAKEGLIIQQESQTLASTTFQNYFRLYEKLAGMTGTADTEAFEFKQIYGLDVVVIPTNVAVNRTDLNDLIFLTQKEKFEAVINDIRDTVGKGAPVLVGTASVETSELLSEMLRKEGIKHNVLNAKQHEREASIIVNAGRPGSVTIATNMAGRGTDIVLGGNLEVELKALKDGSPEEVQACCDAWAERQKTVILAGGLHIIATERHESRRIDNQLRGRCGRQGDPGVSRFYLSLEDPLMRLFASDRVKNMMRSMGMGYGEAIEHRMVTNAIVKAQRKVEGRNFDIRKHLLEYDDVANDQRQVIYQQRNDLLSDADISEIITQIRADVVNRLIDDYIIPGSLDEQWDTQGLERKVASDFDVEIALDHWLEEDNRLGEPEVRDRILNMVQQAYETRHGHVGEYLQDVERQVMLHVLDNLWKEHLSNMDQLRQGIGLRAYAQKNPKQEYKRESFALFEELLENVKYETVRFLNNVQISSHDDLSKLEKKRRDEQSNRAYSHEKIDSNGQEQHEKTQSNSIKNQPVRRHGNKMGRNEPCSCGSGKKFKHCCGKIT
jgi:preprotein translocase subunit SecA